MTHIELFSLCHFKKAKLETRDIGLNVLVFRDASICVASANSYSHNSVASASVVHVLR